MSACGIVSGPGSDECSADSDCGSVSPPVCGDKVCETGRGETNDPTKIGPYSYYCPVDCGGPTCGNGIKESNEQCDDGNHNNDDGCDGACHLESGFTPTLSVAPASASILVGQSAYFLAYYDPDGPEGPQNSYSPGSATWTSDNPSIAYQDGFPLGQAKYTGAKAGITQARAAYNGLQATAVIIVSNPPKPTISLNPPSLTFNGTSGGATPSGQTLTINNTGSATLNWTFSRTGAGTWCNLSSPSGSIAAGSSQNVTVTVSAPSNTGSFNDCGIRISDSNATNSPQDASVTYVVIPNNPGCIGGSCGGGGGGGGGGPGSPVTAVNSTCQQITLSWQAASGASAYNVYRNTSNNSGTATAIQSNLSALSYNDSSASVGTNYYYWVEAVGGGLVSPNKVGANTNNSGGISPTSCLPPPSAPTGGPTYNSNDSNPPGNGAGGSGSGTGSTPVACSKVRLSWTDNSNNETGFKIYMDGVYQITAPASTPAASVGALMTYDFSPLNSNPHSYSLSAVNATGESSQIASTNNLVAAIACQADLSASDKDIVGLNGDTWSNGDCDTFQQKSPAVTSFKLGDVLKFEINLCNYTGQANATSVVVTDQLTNLSQPSSGWQAQLDGSNMTQAANCITPPSGQFSVCGTSPTQTLKFNVNTVNQGLGRKVTFFAQIQVPANFAAASSRLQNVASITYNKDSLNTPGTKIAQTPLILFIISNVPIKEEIAP